MDEAPVPSLAFASQVCFSCYRAPPQTEPLKRCGGCKRVKFCSSECSRKEWKDHAPFCKAFAALRQRPNAYLPPLSSYTSATADELSARRQTHKAQWMLEDELLQAALKRQPTLLESLLLWREPRCRECGDREGEVELREGKEDESAHGWTVCKGCRVTQWCCSAHEKLGEEGHRVFKGEDGRTQCQTLQLATEIDEFFLRHSLTQADSATPDPPALWVPRRILSSPQPLPASWEAYLSDPAVLKDLPAKPAPTQAQIYGVWLEALSPVISLLAGLRRLSSTVDEVERLEVHMLEETHQSISTWIPALEELQHQLLALKHLSVLTLSPADSRTTPAQTPSKIPLPTCPACKEMGRKRNVANWQRVPPNSVLSKREARVAMVLNRSFANSGPESPFWKDHLKALFAASTPVIFLSMTAEEASDELSAVMEWAREAGMQDKVEVVWDVERNPWAGGWPRIDGWEEDGITRRGGYWFSIRRKG